MDPEPAFAVTVPPQVLLTLGVLETTNVPVVEGSASLKPTPVSVVDRLALLMVNVTVVVPFSGMLAAPKLLEMVGGATTVNVAVLLVPPVPLSVEVTLPVVLFRVPAVTPFTFTEKVHDALAARV